MKVYRSERNSQYKRTPSIVLKRHGSRSLGFDIGEQIEVKCEDAALIITKANEIWSAEFHTKQHVNAAVFPMLVAWQSFKPAL